MKMTKSLEGYMKGVNLGGWLSQCNHTKERYETFITKDDIAVIASWKCDHVRLPVDYNVFMQKDGTFIPEGFKYIDNAISWCKEFGLNLVLDIHKTVGFHFDPSENETGFFDNADYQQIFKKMWAELARRYGNLGNQVIFELLNEVTSPSFNVTWNRVAVETIAEIRKHAPSVKILFAGYWNGSIDSVKDLVAPPDENVIYNFHCYSPLIFTHQSAPWMAGMPTDNYQVPYPVTYDDENVQRGKSAYEIMCIPWPKGTLEEDFESAWANGMSHAEKYGSPLYCGEYGVIDLADPESTLAWYKSIHAAFKKMNIGHALWTYKSMNFGISDEHYKEILKGILELD